MKECTYCGKQYSDEATKCSIDGKPLKMLGVTRNPGRSPEDKSSNAPQAPQWRLSYRVFRGTLATWEELFRQAAAFASEVGPERVVSISHSEDNNDGVVAVWYWTENEPVA